MQLSGSVSIHGAVSGLITPDGLIELFLVSANVPQLLSQGMWYVLSCLWDDAYKRTLAVN